MSPRSRLRPFSIGLLLLASLAAAAPVVRHCPFDWADVDLRTYATCAAMPKVGVCHADVAACGAMESCPLRAASAGEPDVAEHRCGAKSPHARGNPHAYCLDEPFMATASRAHPPLPPAPLAIATAIVTIEVPATVRPAVLAVEARPPTESHVARPPIRGPPSLLG